MLGSGKKIGEGAGAAAVAAAAAGRLPVGAAPFLSHYLAPYPVPYLAPIYALSIPYLPLIPYLAPCNPL